MFVRYKCKAIGSGSEGAQSTLQEGYSDSLTLAEAEALAVSTLKQVRGLEWETNQQGNRLGT